MRQIPNYCGFMSISVSDFLNILGNWESPGLPLLKLYSMSWQKIVYNEISVLGILFVFRYTILFRGLSNYVGARPAGALNDAVSSWRLLACSFFNSSINSQRCVNCCLRGPITALICFATSSNLTEMLGEFSTSWSDIPTRGNCFDAFGFSATCYLVCLCTYGLFHNLEK